MLILVVTFGIFISWAWFTSIWMPGKSYKGLMPPLTKQEATLKIALQQDVEKLSSEIGEHNFYQYKKLVEAANFLEASLTASGYKVQRQTYQVTKQTFSNLEVEIKGTNRYNEIVVIGGHYDSVLGSPGGNDNSSGAAAVLELARIFAGKKTSRTLRFVEFVNEEPPFFQTNDMGSMVYAKRCRKRGENVVAMVSLETIGYYSNEPGSQKYTFPINLFYPSVGNFIGFIGNPVSGNLVRNAIASFRRHTQYPSEGVALPDKVPGVGWSDQWAFWQQGYPGVMVTDTAPFRYPYYHTLDDTPDKINYERMARVVAGLEKVIADLAG
ncbi:MAG: M28 family peptidase [Coleofasciculaceae cyanobacterium]